MYSHIFSEIQTLFFQIKEGNEPHLIDLAKKWKAVEDR